jgi:TatD DNase family protein
MQSAHEKSIVAARPARKDSTPVNPPLVDIGINLAHDSYDADRDQVLARARAAGVVQLVVTGSSIDSTRRAIDLVRSHPGVLRATAGVHPHHAGDLGAQHIPELRELMQAPEVGAAGECGLDYFRNFSSHADQLRAFRWQLELAAGLRRPVFLHQRDAHEDFMAVLREFLPQLPAAVAHCFTGNARELDDYLEAGLHIGITGWISDERRGRHLPALVRRIPADRLMLETDGPYLLPRNIEPRPATRRNEPMYLVHVCKAVAAARDEDPASVAAATTANARRFFGFEDGYTAHELINASH